MLDDFLLGNYKTVSERLGLAVEGGVLSGDVRIHGAINGVPVQIWFGPHATHTNALLTVAAPIELSIVTTSLFGKVAHLFTNDHTSLGDAELDKTFSVKSPDLPRLAALLNPEARRALLEVAKEGLHPAVEQSSVHLRRFSNGGSDAERTIERDLREAVRLAAVLGASFASAAFGR